MNAGTTSERVYRDLKDRLLEGRLRAGARIEPVQAAKALVSSATPVRDALNRLVGERLVVTRSGEGFFVPLLTEKELRDLYGWNHSLARMLGRERPGRAQRPFDVSGDVAVATGECFRWMAADSGNAEAERQLAAMAERLMPARRAESAIFASGWPELQELMSAISGGDRGAFVRCLDRYHRRRMSAVPQIVLAMNGSHSSPQP